MFSGLPQNVFPDLDSLVVLVLGLVGWLAIGQSTPPTSRLQGQTRALTMNMYTYICHTYGGFHAHFTHRRIHVSGTKQ